MRSDNDEMIDIFSAIRHDWLNVLQLIKGNLALGNEERIEAVIQEAVEHSANESKLCSLDMPNTIFLLLQQKWSYSKQPLEIEVDGELFSLRKYDHSLASCFALFLDQYNQLQSEVNGHLTLSFTFFDSKCLIEVSSDYDLNKDKFNTCWATLPSEIQFKTIDREGYAVTILINA
ncbi:sporulation initiation phosphotransferase B [Bacillus sp. JCM 19046]|uniref:Stage 0 sporulation protein B (Sporulation initiation phosphotransferase) n=1 Tax=Shouchella xiaoxiensis TaxID=766895 RepID=A0ABS2SR33_9BACI|nr:Spo0B domain-containing protein [Shouchella xiaoxiensis]MBM7837979.1 stage 0 sporulation protein B (sporulation initiation phosphotransferase) [Shouchella xiaoxiensis]GAF12280.1 sporulation initiation phosphotransferase B [Bacillus sp. JCM 19045]GAF18662.1 sporulation initiation phosphotransferase B [Bacillus sp. JCM 19046]